MTVSLSPAELAAIEEGRAVRVQVEGLQGDCILIRADLCQRVLGSSIGTSAEVDQMYPLLAEISPEDWEEASAYGLDRRTV